MSRIPNREVSGRQEPVPNPSRAAWTRTLALLGLGVLALAWLLFTPPPADAATPCGGNGQRACCFLEASFGACGGSTTEVNGCSGGSVEGGSCACPGIGSSNSHCVQATGCGGEGQRACCVGEGTNCQGGLAEIPGCSGNCICGGEANPFGIQSSGTCIRPTACGAAGQRACCLLENPAIGACGGTTTEVNGCEGVGCTCGGFNPSGTRSNSHCVQATGCGGLGQRACCVGEGTNCQSGLAETPGCSGDCVCGGEANPFSISSSGHCIQPTACGAAGQRACCLFENTAIGACGGTTTEVNGCDDVDGSCTCGGANVGASKSNSHCIQATDCGGAGQRACCLGEAAFCDDGLAEIPGCSGDCVCGGEANPFSISASGTCIQPSPCGAKGQRACVVFERSEGACDEGLFETPRCVGDCFGKGVGSAYGVASGMCTEVETTSEPTTNRTVPPPTAATTASSTCPLYGYMDMHLHLFADLAHGGAVLAGKPYDEAGGINVALQQCAGSNLDFVTQDLVTNAETTVSDPGSTCPSSFYPDGCGNRIFHGGHDVFDNDAVGSPLATRDGALEGLLGENSNLGAPAFNGWPRWTTTTHQQAYYKWLERAWQGGLRLTTMLAVTNEALCKGGKHLRGTNCEDSMQSIDDQIAEAYKFETFIDKQYGTDAENKGWFRIVLTPAEARRAIAAGKLAVVLGVETAELFNCKFPIDQCTVLGDGTAARVVVCPSTAGFTATGPHTTPNDTDPATPMCTPDFVKGQVEKYHDMGVRHVFPIHNFDNGFGGAATWQDAIEVGNRLVEKHWWFTETCPPDPLDYGFELDFFTQLFVSLLKFGSVIKEPAIHLSSGPSCNSHGLFSLGQTLVSELMNKGMLIDVDHMSRRAFDKTLDMADARHYPGIVASHVLSFDLHDQEVRHERMRTKAQLQRIKNVGGMVAAMLKDEVQDAGKRGAKHTIDYDQSNVTNDCRHSSKSFTQAFEYAVDVMGGPVAMGSDFNGVAGHFGPRFGSDACGGFADHADVAGRDQERSTQYRADNRIAYPFTLPGFGTFEKQKTGQRTFDYNVDGMAHVGLLPDFVADLRKVGLAESHVNMLFRSSEAYIKVWEGARSVGLGEPPAADAPACVTVAAIHPSTVVDGTVVPFSATATPPGATVTWTFGDGTSGSGAQVTHQYSGPGTYMVVARATDPFFGTTAEHTGSIVIRPVDVVPPAVTVPGPISREATSPLGAAVSFEATAHDNLDGALAASCTRASGSTFPLGPPTTVTCSATDAAGNTGSASFQVSVVDTTPPEVTVLVSPASNAAGWHQDPLTIVWTRTDVVGVTMATGCDTVTFAAETSGTAVTCTAGDAAGNAAGKSVTVRLDRTAPRVVFGAPSPGANASGWHRSDVTVPFAIDEGGSGLPAGAAASGTLTFSTEGTGLTQTLTLADLADNVAIAVSPAVNLDKTAPTIAASRDRAPNANDWYNADVTVSFACGDQTSGIETCGAPQTIAGEGANQSAAGLARDLAGNEATAVEAGINLDETPPGIAGSRSPDANVNGWNNEHVTVSFSCEDSLSGVLACSPAATLTAEGGSQSRMGTAQDLAGNEASAIVEGINIDLTPPTIAGARDRAPNASNWYNADVTVEFTCGDALSGVGACGPTPQVVSEEGQNLSRTAAVTDLAGNTVTSTVGGINLDKTVPAVACSSLPSSLWPPNHKLVPVQTIVTVSDGLSSGSGFKLMGVTSNEPDAANDIQGFTIGTPDTSGQLRAERAGQGTGRVYSLLYQGSDFAGNVAACTTLVTVAHDQGK